MEKLKFKKEKLYRVEAIIHAYIAANVLTEYAPKNVVVLVSAHNKIMAVENARLKIESELEIETYVNFSIDIKSIRRIKFDLLA